MSVASRVRAMWCGVVRRRAVAAEVREELLFHVEARAERLMGQGVPAAEARRRARVELGVMVANGAEVHRRATGMRLLDETWGDVRYGLRGLWRNKGFALTAVLSLAIGIGATTAMFSVVYAVLLDVYPYADAERTVNPIVHDPAVPDDWNWFVLTPAQYAVYRASPAFEDVFAMSGMTLMGDDEGITQPLQIALMSGNAWSFNGVPALLGRTLQPSDGDIGAKQGDAAVLSYKYWRRHYGGDRNVVGKEVKAGTRVFRIVGVMPERFTVGAPDMYMPVSNFLIDKPHYVAFAKLKKGVTAAQASAMVDPMLHQFAKDEPTWFPKNFHARLQLLLEGFTARSKLLKNFPLLYMAVGSLLLIGCANCSLLLLARGTTRVYEFALRAAVGAGRARMVRQLLVECVTIAVLGSLLGTGLAYVLARLPLVLAADLFPTEAVIRINGWVLLVAVVTAVLAGVGFGLAPALKFSRPEIGGMLNASGRRTMVGGNVPLRWLVGAQIALTIVLLTVSAAAAGGFVRLTRLPLGYDPKNAMIVATIAMKDVANTWQERVALQDALQSALRRVPGVVSASLSDGDLPGGGSRAIVHFEGEDGTKESQYFNGGSDMLKTLRIPLVRGRMFSEAEWRQGLPMVVVNETFARKFSPGREVLDRIIVVPLLDAFINEPGPGTPSTFSPAIQGGKVQVIGVAADVMNDGMEKPIAPEIYMPSTLQIWPYFPFVVRTVSDPHQTEKLVAKALHGVGAKVAVQVLPNTLQEAVEHEAVWRTQRLVAVLLSLFAVGALLLSLVGLYSVAAYGVAQRRAEFGIRMALGAPREGILRLVMGQNAVVIVAGALAGVLLALVVRARFAAWSEGSSRSPAMIAVAAGVLVLTALGASLLPAWRASRVDPAEALQAE